MDNSRLPEDVELSSEELELLAALFAADEQAEATGPTSALRQTVEYLPLSFGQQRLWFLDQLEPGNPAYNIPFAMRLRGSLNPAALEWSLNEVVRRHEVLRTSFTHRVPEREDQLRQVIAPEQTVTIEQVDLRGLTDEDRQARVQRLAEASDLHAFSLAHGPLLKATLARLDAEEWAFFLNIHHIIFDGWSVALFTREIIACYEARHTARPVDLPPLPIQYADYAIWQQQQAQTERFEQQLAYWRAQLANLPVLSLPTDYPRPSRRTSNGATLPVTIEAALDRQLRALSQQSGCTPFMTLLAAWQVLLMRYSNQRDIAVGSPVAGRLHSETEPLIGFFVNTLVLRTDLTGNPSFRVLLERVRTTALAAFDHQMVPFDRLVEELQPERSLSHTPLVQTMFTLQTFGAETIHAAGVDISPLVFESKIAKFDLMLTLTEQSDGLRGELEYSTDLFEQATIARLAGHFQTLLAAIVAAPDQPIQAIPLLSAADRELLLTTWNSTTASYPATTIATLFDEQVARTPEAIALIHGSDQVSYAELNRRAHQLAHELRRLGVGPDVPVGVCMERSPELVVGMLGILKAGGAYLPLDPGTPPARLQIMLADARVPVLLTQQALHTAFASAHTQIICLDSEWPTIEAAPHTSSLPSVDPDHLAYVIYTSGSTGTPKGVAVQHRAATNLIAWHQRSSELTPDDRISWVAGLAFDASVWEIWPALTSGAQLHLPPDDIRADPVQMVAWLRTQTISVCFLPTPLAEAILALPASTDLPLRRLLTGGDVLHAQPSPSHPWPLVNHYGPTETAVVATAGTVSLDGTARPSIGKPIANTAVYVLDQQLQPVPVGVAGEIYIGGVQVARGYLHRPDLTAERFVPDPFATTPGSRLYRTGDLARYLPDGCIDFLGRIDDQVKLRGFRIELGEIEAVLRQHPAVSQAVVDVRAEQPGELRLVAYVTENKEQTNKEQRNNNDPTDSCSRFSVLCSPQELRAFLSQHLPSYMIPSAFVVLDALPITANGKINRRLLPAPDGLSLDSEHSLVLPRTPAEELIAGIWASVLGLERVSIHENFFTLGGHSLLATQVVSRLRETFQVDLPLRSLFETPTVSGLAEAIQSAQAMTGLAYMPPITRVARDQPLPLSFAQQRLWFLDQLAPDNPFYSIPVALRLSGTLDVAALERSLAAIVERHESLRTTFPLIDGEPIQQIAPHIATTLPIVDLRSLPADERETQARQLMRAEVERPFNLSSGPLLRALLVQLSETDWILLLSMHHIISDGWSMGVLVNDLIAWYTTCSRADSLDGAAAPLPELPIQYADFAVQQRAWLTGEVLEAQLSYWKQRLGGDLPPLELPTDRPRPAAQSFQGAAYRFLLPKSLHQTLTALSQREGVTLYMTLLAAWQTLLYRYTAQEDMLIGSPIANRTRPEIEGLIGFFVNTLVLRTDLSGNPTFRQLLQRVREVTLGAYMHQDLPFEHLVEQLHPDRDLSRQPIFQVMFALQNAPVPPLSLDDLTCTLLDLASDTAKFDLILFMWEQEDGLSGMLEYSTDLFDESTISRLVGHLHMILERVSVDASQPLTTVPLLTDAERSQLLGTWNPAPVALPARSIPEAFAQQVARAPERIAVIADETRLTYRELDQRSNHVAHQLIRAGVGPETRVALCLDRSPDLLVAILAILKAGGAYVPLDPTYPRQRLNLILSDSQVSIVMTQPSLASVVADTAAKLIVLDPALPPERAVAGPACEIVPQQLAYVMYTSGSTGVPKGVAVPHQAVLRLVHQPNYLAITPDDVLLQLAPPAFDAATLEIWGALLCGASVVLAPAELPGLAQIGELIRAHQVSILWLTAGLFHLMVDQQLEDLVGVGQLLAGGDVLSVPHVQRFLAAGGCLINGYGPTENTTFTACYPIPANATLRRSVPIGRPITNTTVYLLDAALQPVPIGVVGELYTGGLGLARGYLDQPASTAERFIPDPFSASNGGAAGARMYRTGDLARYLPDGTIEFLGRRDHQVKLRGFRIELGEIATVLAEHEQVRDALVVAHTVASGDTRLVGYVVPALPTDTSTSEQSAYVDTWQTLYDETYGQEESDDPTFHIVGWNSSYSGQPFPPAEMREWRDATVARIQALGPTRVLEIGCGTGLLLFPLAGQCRSYHGVDFSAPALAHIRRHLPADWSHVTLAQQRADELTDLAPASVDTVILNSVIQYFPSVEYLVEILSRAVAAIAPGGHLFVGDVRSRPLLQTFATAVALAQAQPETSREALQSQVQDLIAHERELLLDPAFFHALRQRLPRISDVQVEIKRGCAHNELTQFRYDVTLTVEGPPPTKADAHHHWTDDSWTIEHLGAELREFDGESLLLRAVPSARLQPLVQAAGLLGAPDGPATVQSLQAEVFHAPVAAVDPEWVWELGAKLGYDVRVGWSESGASGCYDVVFRRGGKAALPQPTIRTVQPWSAYATAPAAQQAAADMTPRLFEYLQARLPEYMVPAALIPLDTFPLTPNGKVDRAALPTPSWGSSADLAPEALPRTPVEMLLADIWRQVLGVPAIGIHDNFFELGGHSLLATQVMSRVRTVLGVHLPVRMLFEHPTIVLLSRVVTAAQREAQALPPLPPLTPAAPDEALPLSFAQQRLWFIEQLEPGTASYHVPGVWEIHGQIDREAFQASLDLIVARHASLRTTFTQGVPEIDGQPVQRIAPPQSFPITLVDLTGHAADVQQEVRRYLQAASTQPFDLASGPLMRVSLIQLDARTHILLLVMHHIITDGWSMGVFAHELAAAYIGTIRNQPIDLPTLPVQYPDYAVWQRTWLDPTIPGGILEAQLAYWQRQLAGVPTLDLPTDHLRPPVESHRGAMLPVALDRGLVEQLAHLSRQQGTTVFMTLLAGWYVLLARYSGQDDIAVGTPIAGRTQPETEPLIGFFVNTLVLRTSLDGRPTFRDLLERVRTTTLDAYAHQDAPFESVVERLQPERDRSRQPLFQVLFALMNAPLPEIALPEIHLAPLEIENTTAKFDLSLLLFDTPSGVSGSLEYATDLFDEVTITRMIQQYQLVLSAMAASPDQPIDRVALIGEAEQRQLTAWNASARPYPRDAAVHTLIEAQAARTPDTTAIVFEGASLTYAQLNARANQLAHYLRGQNVGPDVIVALCVERSLEMIVGMLAILKAGGAYLPLDPNYPAERLQYMLSHSRASVMLTQAALVEHVPEHTAQVFCLDADWPTLASQPTTNPPRVVLPDNLAYIIYTSGSTGRPKGVMVKQQGLINLVYGLRAYFDDPVVQITGLITSISFDISVNQIFPTLIFGRTLHIIPDAVKFNSRALLRYLDEQQIHLLDAVPSYLQTVLKDVAPDQPANALRYLLIGGEKLEQRLLHAVFGQLGAAVEIVNIYGLTEISDINILGSIRAQDLDKPITVGRPLQNNRIYIVDAHNQPQPVGIAGEVCVAGESVSRGYLFRPELTAERFVVCPFEDGQIMVRTGDLGRWRPDGTVEILGRIDQQVKLRGFRIELGEIEAALAKHPTVREAAVMVREDSPGDQRLVAYVVENKEQTNQEQRDQVATTDDCSLFSVLCSPQELRHFLSQHLPGYMLPSAFIVLDQMPRTPNGKLNRNALPAPDHEQSGASRTYVGPRNALELQLVQIWEELLPTRPIGVTDNFFELGGHSLIAIRLVAQIQKQLGQRLPLGALFEGATIEQLAGLVRRQAGPSQSALVGIRATGTRPPFFCIHPSGGDVLCYRDLAARLDTEQPFYGLQAAGLDGEQAPDTTIEAMATRYLAALQTRQPEGPYYLGGWSLGGVIAFEVARQIQQQGQKVAALVLIDSYLTRPGVQNSQLDLLTDFALQIGLAEDQLTFLQDDQLLEQDVETAFTYALERLQQAHALPAELSADQLRDRFGVFRAHTAAMNSYQPRPFGGPITVIQSQHGNERVDLGAAWAPLVDGVSFHTIPGTHFTMMREPDVAALAGLLTDCLARPSITG